MIIMSSTQRRLAKKKKREKESKKKVLRRRDEMRARKKAERLSEREQDEKEKELEKELKEMEQLDAWADEVADKLPKETRNKIEHNIEILKALEEEYDREKTERENRNKELEKDGHATMDQKLRALRGEVIASTSEVSDVEVIKNSSEDEQN